MEKFYSLFGKAVLVFVLLAGASFSGIYIYKNSQKTVLPNPTPPLPSAASSLPSLPSPLASPQPQTKTVTAGLGVSSGLSFTQYQLELPQGWVDNHQFENTGTPVDTLTLTNGADYQIKIFQAATGGALCLYPGDPNFEGPSSRYDNFVSLSTQDGVALRRSGTTAYSGGKRGFTVCQKASDGSFQQPTVFGHMSLSTPVTPDAAKLQEIDQMIASLKKI